MTSTSVWSETLAASATDTSQDTSTTTSQFTVKKSTTYVLLVSRGSGSGDAIAGISATNLSSPSFTSIGSQNFTSGGTTYYQWAYWVTTASNATGKGTLTVTFHNATGSGQQTTVSLIQLAGNDTTNPIVNANVAAATGSGTAATAALPNAPDSSDAELVLLTGADALGGNAPSATGLTNLFYANNSAASAGAWGAIPAQESSSFTIPSQAWGTIAFELNHG